MDDNHDKVLETYYGRHGSKRAQEALRARVHWVLQRTAIGPVLDVGCSQGLLAILLGRAGIETLGIDSREGAIHEARSHLAEEAAATRERVSFQCVNLHDLGDMERFAGVTFGEVIEHLAHPARSLDAIARLLRPEGELVLTTPFSIHPDPDHKHTFFASSILALLSPHFHIVEFEVLEHFICVRARKRNEAETSAHRTPSISIETLLAQSEAGFEALHRACLEDLRTVRFMLSEEKRARAVLEARVGSLEANERATEELTHLLRATARTLPPAASVGPGNPSGSRPTPVLEAGRDLAARVEGHLAASRATLQQLDAATRRVAELERLELSLRSGEPFRQLEHEVAVHRSAAAFQTQRLRELERRPLQVISRLFDKKVPPQPEQARASAQQRAKEQPNTRATVTKIRPRLAVRAASILDEFSEENLRYELGLMPLRSKDWMSQMEESPPDILLVESAWNGNGGEWKYLITYKEARPSNPLFSLLEYCREHGIPTVFWNKEDPTNYDQFIDAARRFDYVFTTDANCLERYAVDAPSSKIAVMPFAAQPSVQNPVDRGRLPVLGDVCFAGAWYARHPERFEDLANLLAGAKGRKVDIYDRYLNHPDHDKYKFPDEYASYIRGSLPFEEMLEKYRQYKVFLNVNSVKTSPTMFSRRVFELLACGTAVVSGPAEGISAMLGEDIVPMARSAAEARAQLDVLLDDDLARERLILKAQRRIFTEHTYEERVRSVCQHVGITLTRPRQKVTCVTATIRPDFVDAMLENFARQTHEDRELVVVVNENRPLRPDFVLGRAAALGVPNVRVLELGEGATLGRCLNEGVLAGTGDIFAKMDDDDHYGAEYLRDSLQALSYSKADCVGKETYFTYLAGSDRTCIRTPGREHRTTQFIIGTTIVAPRSIIEDVRFGDKRVGEDSAFLRNLQAAGRKLYSHSKYNYVKLYASSLDHHTWKVDEEEYTRGTVHFRDGRALDEICL